MTRIRFIGDVHGAYGAYLDCIGDAERSVQVGDFGMGFLHHCDIEHMHTKVNPEQHKFIRGNHDDPAMCKAFPHYIPDCSYDDELSMFFMGGAWSIDRWARTEGINWWPDEELNYAQLSEAIDIFERVKPAYVVTHDCPFSVAQTLFKDVAAYPVRPTDTSRALDLMLKAHQPKMWLFGHWHHHCREVIEGCEFVCLDINQAIDIEVGS